MFWSLATKKAKKGEKKVYDVPHVLININHTIITLC